MKKGSMSLYRRTYGFTQHELAAQLRCSTPVLARLHGSGKLRLILDGTVAMPRKRVISLQEQRKIILSPELEFV